MSEQMSTLRQMRIVIQWKEGEASTGSEGYGSRD